MGTTATTITRTELEGMFKGMWIENALVDGINTALDRNGTETTVFDIRMVKWTADDGKRKGLTTSKARRVAWYLATGEIVSRITAKIAEKFDGMFTSIESLKPEVVEGVTSKENTEVVNDNNAMNPTLFAAKDGRVIYRHERDNTHWVINADGTVSPMKWGDSWVGMNINEAEVDSTMRVRKLHFEINEVRTPYRKSDVLNATEWVHVEHGRIYENSHGAYWVLNDDGTVSPLVWGKPYNNAKARHISEAEVDTLIKHSQSMFEIRQAETAETSTPADLKSEKDQAYRVYDEARQAFETYADTDGSDYQHTLKLNREKREAHKVYREKAEAWRASLS